MRNRNRVAVTRASRRAFALIVALGMLALMSAVALTFVAMTTAELGTANAFNDQVRARMVSAAGLEWAVAELRRAQGLAPWSTPPETPLVPAPGLGRNPWSEPLYFRDNTAVGEVVALSPDFPAPANPFVRVLGMGASLRLATRPSFYNPAVPNGLIAAPAVGWVSGYESSQTYLPGQHRGAGDYFLLKAIDCTQQINVNVQAGAQLRMMMRNLVRALYDPDVSSVLPLIGAPEYVGKFPAGQPTDAEVDAYANEINNFTVAGNRFNQKDELLALPVWNSPAGRLFYNLIRDYISVYGNPDTAVVLPTPSWPAGLYAGTAGAHPGLVRQPFGRFPVNVNNAPAEVLIAVLTGIKGRYMVPTEGGGEYRGKKAVTLTKEISDLTVGEQGTQALTRVWEITPLMAKELTRAIIERRGTAGPFRSWREFRNFLDALRGTWNPASKTYDMATPLYNPVTGLTPFVNPNGRIDMNGTKRSDIVDLVWANCNPNAIFNRFNGDLTHQWGFEKAALTWAGADPTSTTELCLCGTGTFEIESIGRVLGAEGTLRGEYSQWAAVQVFDVIRHTTQRDFESPSGGSGVVTLGGLLTWPEPTGKWSGAAIIPPNDFDGRLILTPAAGGGTFPFFPEANPPITGNVNPLNKLVESLCNYPGGSPNWGDHTPDGLLCLRDRNRQLRYTMNQNDLQADEGAIELWVKLMTKPDSGSDEPILYTIANKNVGGLPPGSNAGVSWKLERFGDKLVSTRFWWVRPVSADPADGPKMQAPPEYTNTYTERHVDISNWKPGTWHHILHRWTAGTTQTLMSVDGADRNDGEVIVVTGVEPAGNTATETITEIPPQEGPPPVDGQRIHQWHYITYTMDSNDLPVGNQSMVCVGGYNYTIGDVEIKNTGIYSAGTYYRGMNGTIDNIGVYGNSAGGVSGRLRYTAGGTFSHPGIDYPTRIVDAKPTAGANLPILSAAMTFYPNTTGSATGTLTVKGVNIPAGGNNPDGAGLGGVLHAFNYVPYSVTLAPGGGINDTPAVDDVTIYVGVPTHYHSLVSTQE